MMADCGAGTSILLRTLQRFQGSTRHHPFISLPSLPDLGACRTEMLTPHPLPQGLIGCWLVWRLAAALLSPGKFVRFAGPIFFALLGKTVCYTALGVAAQQCGTVPLAGRSVSPPPRT